MSSDKQFDVPKNPGKRGESWDGFGIAWQEYAQAQFEMHDDYSLFDVSEGRDQGAVNGPQIAAAGAGQREGISKRKKRQLATQRALSKAQEDPRLRRMIINLAPGDNATNDAAGDGVGRRAWLLLVRECGEAMTPLEIRGRKKEFASATIRGTVGFGVASITDLNRELTLIDSKIPAPQRHGDTEQSERILECVRDECPDSALAHEASKELQATAGRVFVTNAGLPNNRDLNAIVTHFDRLWGQLVKAGKIRVSAPTGKKAESTMLVADMDDDDDVPVNAGAEVMMTAGDCPNDMVQALTMLCSEVDDSTMHEVLLVPSCSLHA